MCGDCTAEYDILVPVRLNNVTFQYRTTFHILMPEVIVVISVLVSSVDINNVQFVQFGNCMTQFNVAVSICGIYFRNILHDVLF